MNDNPYAPPREPHAFVSPPAASDYVPLGWRTALASLALGGRVVFGVAVVLTQARLVGRAGDLGSVLLAGVAALGLIASVVGAVVFFLLWIHRASKNLLALGRRGMDFTPGGCVGWFFVPVANLWKPLQAVAEIWKASDPEAEDGIWFARAQTPLIGLWWATWLVGNVLENMGAIGGKRSDARGFDLVVTGFSAVAVVAIILVMRGIDARQGRLAEQLARGEGSSPS